jgi:hypothetical protein
MNHRDQLIGTTRRDLLGSLDGRSEFLSYIVKLVPRFPISGAVRIGDAVREIQMTAIRAFDVTHQVTQVGNLDG